MISKQHIPLLQDLSRRLTCGPASPVGRLKRRELPDRFSIESFLRDFYQLFFLDSMRDEQTALRGSTTEELPVVLQRLYAETRVQLGNAFNLSANCVVDQPQTEPVAIPVERIDGLLAEFFTQLPRVHELLHQDLVAAYAGDPACRDPAEVALCYPGWWATLVHRLAHVFYQLQVPYLPRILSEAAHSSTGIDIHPGAEIGERFFIDHGTGVVIGETCRIGNNVRLYQGVTLGAASFALDANGQMIRGEKRHPTIEDDVVIYANATVLGGRTLVGRGSIIGSNVWLTHSVEPGTTVVMEKPQHRIRQRPADFSGALDFQI